MDMKTSGDCSHNSCKHEKMYNYYGIDIFIEIITKRSLSIGLHLFWRRSTSVVSGSGLRAEKCGMGKRTAKWAWQCLVVRKVPADESKIDHGPVQSLIKVFYVHCRFRWKLGIHKIVCLHKTCWDPKLWLDRHLVPFSCLETLCRWCLWTRRKRR